MRGSPTSENFCASSVALEMSSLRSGRKRAMSLTRPNSTSVCSVLSWASSIIITLQAGQWFSRQHVHCRQVSGSHINMYTAGGSAVLTKWKTSFHTLQPRRTIQENRHDYHKITVLLRTGVYLSLDCSYVIN